MNKKIFLILLLVLAQVIAEDLGGEPSNTCHNSCASCLKNVCLSCDIENTHVEPLKRACVCDEGFYAYSLNPLECRQKISGEQQNRCEVEIALNVQEFIVNTLCYYDSQENNNLVISEVSIDTDHCFFDNQDCRKDLVTLIQYRPKGNDQEKEDDQYIPLPLKYIEDLGAKAGDKKIKIPLIDVYDLAYDQSISNDQTQIVQHIYFRIMIGFARKFVRAHRWCMTVYTNRQQIQTFVIDVDIQRTESCQDGQECIIIADLDVTGDQFTDNWGAVRPNHQYIVGDWMYMKIWFKDSTYTKQLSFQKLYFKNEEGHVFDHTSLTDGAQTKWDTNDKTLHVKLRLIEPGQNAVVQVNMLIEMLDARLRRVLQSTEQTPVKQQFKADILSPINATAASTNQDSEKASSFLMFFGILNLLALIFFY